MAFAWLKKLIPSKNDRELRKIFPIVDRVNALEPGIQKLSDTELQAKTAAFRQRLENGEDLDSLAPEAFAVVREAGWRRLKMRHYDVQIIGGMVLHRGNISEMKTGEGKTLVATLALYLNALPGRGSHLVTVNDYLAKRDAEWMSRIYRWLGLSVGVIVPDLSDWERKDAYASDITYGTNNEFGFDYLRDNLKFEYEKYVHRYYPIADAKTEKERHKLLNFAIVDEVDSVLIDEARTPLIISGPGEESSHLYLRVNAIIPFLRRDEDFIVDEKAHTVTLTESGMDKIEQRLSCGNLYDVENMEILHIVNQSLRAHFLYRRDVNYLVEEGKIIIVDEFTGRKMYGRRWSDGMHQAVEAKEGVPVQEENQTVATITFQNYFRMYKKLSGMTGTADTEAEEFAKIYDLDVIVIPTNRTNVRKDAEDLIYKTEKMKLTAICDEIKVRHEQHQPILVGTTSVEKSEQIAKILRKNGIPHEVLNAKNHAREADIVAQAGRKGSVTIATNMAGRGTDILLGGNPEIMAKAEADGVMEGEEFERLLEQYRVSCKAEGDEVRAAGGLHIIGTERHESRRIDNQLRGRAGRQGDPGSSRFYLSLDDELMRIFGGDRIKKIMEMLKVPDDEPIEAGMVSRAVENAQRRVEGHNFDIRKNVLEYDDVMNQQRRTIYERRRNVLEGSRTHEMVHEVIGDVAHALCDQFCSEDTNADEWDLETLALEATRTFNMPVDLSKVDHEFEALFRHIEKAAVAHYEDRERRIVATLLAEHTEGEDVHAEALAQWRFFEREQYLRAIDRLWKAHLVQMDHLRTGIHLEAYAQKDPKIAYKKEGYELFQELLVGISKEVARRLFFVEVKSQAEIDKLKEHRQQKTVEMHGDQVAAAEQARAQSQQSAPKPVTVRNQGPKVGRNDPCPCGSGKKYKNCHLRQLQAAGMAGADEDGEEEHEAR